MNEPGNRNSGYYHPELEVLSGQARADYLLNRLGESSRYACEAFPDIRAKFDRAGIRPGHFLTIKDLEKFPITREPAFPGKRAVYDEGWTQALFAAGVRPGDLAQITLGLTMSSLAMTLDQSFRKLNVRSIPTGMASLNIQVSLMKDLRVDACVCTSEALTAIADYAEIKGLDVKKELALKIIFLVGENNPVQPLPDLKDRLGIHIRSAFGTAELGCLGYECPCENGLHWPDNVLIEIVEPETGRQLGPGQTGEMVVTTFHAGYPLIRFGSGKLASYTDEPCPCGRTTYRWLEPPAE